jgi:hypothetical protein
MHAFDAVDGSSHRHRERLLAVPSGLIEQHDAMVLALTSGRTSAKASSGGRPHGGIEVGGNEALVGEARRTLALGPPAVAIAPLLADPRLVP